LELDRLGHLWLFAKRAEADTGRRLTSTLHNGGKSKAAPSERTQALAMVRKLHCEIERRRSPHIKWWWCSVNVVVARADDVDG
jgi:hypothetical protein